MTDVYEYQVVTVRGRARVPHCIITTMRSWNWSREGEWTWSGRDAWLEGQKQRRPSHNVQQGRDKLGVVVREGVCLNVITRLLHAGDIDRSIVCVWCNGRRPCLYPRRSTTHWMLNVHWSDFVTITNDEIRSRTQQPAFSDTIRSRRLSFFGHLSCRRRRSSSSLSQSQRGP